MRFRSTQRWSSCLKNNVTKLLFLYNILLHDINNIIVLLLFLYCVQLSYNAYVLLAVCLLVDAFYKLFLFRTLFLVHLKYIYILFFTVVFKISYSSMQDVFRNVRVHLNKLE